MVANMGRYHGAHFSIYRVNLFALTVGALPLEFTWRYFHRATSG